MEKFIDKRCPCLVCLVQTNCTNYCNTFHFYRKLILAEMDFFFAECIYDYSPSKNGGRMMSDLERQLDIAYNICPSDDLYKDYVQIKNKLRYLSSCFSKVIANSHKAKRGVAMTAPTEKSEDQYYKSHSEFMKQAEKQLDLKRRQEECQSST